MSKFFAALVAGLMAMFLVACGGGGGGGSSTPASGGGTTPPVATTYTLEVQNAAGSAVAALVANGSDTQTVAAGTKATLSTGLAAGVSYEVTSSNKNCTFSGATSATGVLTTNTIVNVNCVAAATATPSVWLSKPVTAIPSTGSTAGNECKPFNAKFPNNTGTVGTLTSYTITVSGVGASTVSHLRTTTAGSVSNKTLTNNAATFTGNRAVAAGTTLAVPMEYCLSDTITVANASAINIAITQVTTTESGVNAPIGGTYATPVALTTVDAATAVTKITSSFNGYKSTTPTILAYGARGGANVYNVTGVMGSGQTGAKWNSVCLRNPYKKQITVDNTSWNFDYGNGASTNVLIPQANVSWDINQEYVTIMLPNVPIQTSGYSYSYNLTVSFVGNATDSLGAPIQFDSGLTTPGKAGFDLETKNCLEFLDAGGQKINIDAVSVKQDGTNTGW